MTHMRRWITVVMMVVLFSFIAHSKNIPRFQAALDYRFSLGLTQSALGQVVKYSDNSMHGNSINLTGLWNINNAFSSGVGIGFTTYSYAPNVLPIFATFRYRPFSKTKFQ